MATQRNLSDYGIVVGTLPSGIRGNLADVPGVRVGHCTVDTQRHKTGVTVILPTAPGDNVFEQKCVAASVVLNGFGKTCGLVQVEELGTLETPIALTNTLNVGNVHDAMVEYLTRENMLLRSVNPVVAECNDGGCNAIRARAVGQREVFAAIAVAAPDFAEGDVGAGKGMTCHGLKGGIGSASRLVRLPEYGDAPSSRARQTAKPTMTCDANCTADCAGSSAGHSAVHKDAPARDYVLGVLVLANHGCLSDLCIVSNAVGKRLAAREQEPPKERDEGSCIIVMATDLPLDARQIRRVLRRAAVGLSRVGSFLGHGSGDVVIGFSTANRMPHAESPALVTHTVLNESLMDAPFRAMAEATEEAVLRALLCADSVTGADGKRVASLTEACALSENKAFESFNLPIGHQKLET